MSTLVTHDNALGTYLKDRRTRLDPAPFGFSLTRRRTPGLRREEVAQRANVSATWAPRLQRVLDAQQISPAYVKTSTWDIVAWNHAASVVLADYGALTAEERNALRLVFLNPRVRAAMANWESDARFVVAAFRADIARAGAARNVEALVDELRRLSTEFDAMWRDHDVRSTYGESAKHVRHPVAGLIALEYSAFAVDGRPDLGMVIYNPATPADAERIRSLVKPLGAKKRATRHRRR